MRDRWQRRTRRGEGDWVATVQALLGAGADLAEALRTACDSRDLDLFGSLRYPDVRWGSGLQGCRSRRQTVGWCAAAISRDTFSSITDTEIAGEGPLAAISFTRPAGGTRPQPPDATCQALRIRDGAIIERRVAAAPGQPSAADDLCGRALAAEQVPQVLDVAGEQDVTVVCQGADVCVDYVVASGPRAQFPDPPGRGPVQGALVDPGQETGQSSLPRPSAAPCLADTSRGADHPLAAASGDLDQRCHLPVPALESEQRSGVKD